MGKVDETALWKPIPHLAGRYEASFAGQIRHMGNIKPGIINQHNKRGVMCVRITLPGGQRREQRVHVLVAAAWLGAKREGWCVFHKNGLRRDNSAGNLEYMPRKEVARRAGALAKRQPVVMLNQDGEVLAHYPSARAAGKANFFSYQAIMDRCNGVTKWQKGNVFMWEEDYDNTAGVYTDHADRGAEHLDQLPKR